MSNTQKTVAVLVIVGIVVVVVYIVLMTSVNYLEVDDSFDEIMPTVKWYYDGNPPVGLVPTATHGAKAALLGEPVEQMPRSQEEQVVLYRTMVIPDYERPVLTFWYRMFANDTMDYSDFRVYLLSSDVNLWIKRDGFRTCDFAEDGHAYGPTARFDLHWRMASYDLSEIQGPTMTLVFQNNNLYTNSLGIWTCVDHVEIVDAAPVGPPRAYLPVVMNTTCDPVPTGRIEALLIPPTRPSTPEPP